MPKRRTWSGTSDTADSAVQKTGQLEARRIAFYERNGFVMNPFEYMQPAMGEDRHAIPLRIMSYPKRLVADEFETMRDVLYCHVYRQK